RLVDVLDRQPGRLGELVLRRLAPELHLEPACGAPEFLLPLDDVDGDANRPRVVRDGALHRLADPPGGVGRELVAAAPVELLDGSSTLRFSAAARSSSAFDCPTSRPIASSSRVSCSTSSSPRSFSSANASSSAGSTNPRSSAASSRRRA